jgi:hypothetical protein
VAAGAQRGAILSKLRRRLAPGRAGTAADFARLTETMCLTVFGASPGYRLSWRTNRQTSELPVQS